jgi:polyisoprenoid-binding protein YceI
MVQHGVVRDRAPEASRVKAVIHATSVSTGIAQRDDHLRTKDFFDVAKFPDITFQSTAIEKTADGFVAHGDFTMHGVTKSITLPFHITGEERDPEGKTIIVGFAGQTHLNRQDYGVPWKHPVVPAFVGDDIQIRIRLITKKTPLVAPTVPSQ